MTVACRCTCGVYVQPGTVGGRRVMQVCVPPWGEHHCTDRMRWLDATPDLPVTADEGAEYMRYLLRGGE